MIIVFFQVLKNAGSYDIQVELSLGSIQVEQFLNQHFAVNYADLKTYHKLNDLFPSELNQVKLTALLNPYQYVEVIFW